MELKTYQSRALDDFSRCLDALNSAREQSTAAIESWPNAAGAIPDAVKNYPKMAWQALSKRGGVADRVGGIRWPYR